MVYIPLDAIPSPPCPICGEETVLREGKYGQFFGCFNFPLCRGTVDAKEFEDDYTESFAEQDAKHEEYFDPYDLED